MAGPAAATRMERIEQALRARFAPLHLAVADESQRHRGHAGAADGRGHFAVEIVSEAFSEEARLARHRMVYSALGELMQTDIHALAVQAFTPSEWSDRGADEGSGA